jgi:LacI family transcriptional regulator
LIGSIDRDGADAERYLRMLLEHRVDGILTAAPQMERNTRIGELLGGSVPVVSIHRIPGGDIPLVGSDHVKTALLATRHLLRLGHRRIGTVTGTRNRQVTSMRLKGYERALEEVDIPYDPALVESGDWKADEAYSATLRLLDRAPDITAVYAQNDLMALGVMSALYGRGLSVPDDVAVVGCDDIPMAVHAIPPLTTVHVPFYETGQAAVRLLLDIIAGRTERPRRVLLPVHMVRRGSCGAQTGVTCGPASGEE